MAESAAPPEGVHHGPGCVPVCCLPAASHAHDRHHTGHRAAAVHGRRDRCKRRRHRRPQRRLHLQRSGAQRLGCQLQPCVVVFLLRPRRRRGAGRRVFVGLLRGPEEPRRSEGSHWGGDAFVRVASGRWRLRHGSGPGCPPGRRLLAGHASRSLHQARHRLRRGRQHPRGRTPRADQASAEAGGHGHRGRHGASHALHRVDDGEALARQRPRWQRPHHRRHRPPSLQEPRLQQLRCRDPPGDGDWLDCRGRCR
mmetsp:Transcript_107209/g.341507  ORF Transcript_107209/g.341507 Transcript_107209/m.341507 type:complete len:253 (+) Transcript_107209:418-1176(+)